MTTQLDKALKLAALDIYVFPAYAEDTLVNGKWHRAKTPLTASGFHDATTGKNTIRNWWTQHPDALVAVAAGASGLATLDIDMDAEKGKDGWNSLTEAGITPEDTFHYTTKRGGEHYVYDAHDHAGLNPAQDYVTPSGEILDGIDRRSGGSYFIWWSDRVPFLRELAFQPVPAWFSRTESKVTGDGFEAGLAEWMSKIPSGTPDSKVKKAINDIPEVDFDHTSLLRQQTYLVKLASEGHSGVQWALEALKAAWLRDQYGTEDYAIEFQEALQGAVLKYGKLPDADPLHQEGPITVLRISDLLSRKAPEWWVGGLIQESTVAILAGEAGIGKSFLMLDLGCRIATGLDFHGRPVKKGKVLYVVAEGAASFGKRIMAWQDYNKTSVPEDAIGFVEQGVNLSDVDSMKALRLVLEKEQSDVIILDTLSQLSSVENENDAAQLAAVLSTARKIRELRPGSTVIIVHHVNKSEKGKVRGSSAIRGNADTVIVARPSSSGATFTLSTEVQQDGKQKDGVAETLAGFQLVQYQDSAVVVQQVLVTLTDPYRDAIDAVLSDNEPHALADLMEALTEPEDDNTRQTMRRRLGSLIEDGFAEKVGKAPHIKYRRLVVG